MSARDRGRLYRWYVVIGETLTQTHLSRIKTGGWLWDGKITRRYVCHPSEIMVHCSALSLSATIHQELSYAAVRQAA